MKDILTTYDADGNAHMETVVSTVCHRIVIMDNAPGHHNLEAAAYAEEHWLHVICLPPNLIHIMQVAVFGPLKKKWYRIERTSTAIDKSIVL